MGEVIWWSGPWCQQYVEDTLGYLPIPSDSKEVVGTLKLGLEAVTGWKRTNKLKR